MPLQLKKGNWNNEQTYSLKTETWNEIFHNVIRSKHFTHTCLTFIKQTSVYIIEMSHERHDV